MATTDSIAELRSLHAQAQTRLHRLQSEIEDSTQIERVQGALDYVGFSLERTRPDLVRSDTEAELAGIFRELAEVAAEAISDATGHVDRLLTNAQALPIAQGHMLEQESLDAAAKFRRSAGQHIRGVEREVQQLAERLDQVKADVATQHEAHSKEASEAAASARAELEEITRAANTAKARVEELAKLEEEEFKQAKDQFAGNAAEAVKEVSSHSREQAEALIKELTSLRDQAQGLVGTVSEATTANHFRDDAQRERIAYWVLLGITLVFLAAAVGLARELATNPEPDIQRVLSKLGISGGLIALGYFTGARAKDHRAREKESRDKELEMRAFGPFIEPLPAKEQARERILMGRRFFGGGQTTDPESELRDDAAELLSGDSEIEIAARDARRRAQAT